MDPITRDLIIRLRWQKSLSDSPINEEERRARRVAREQARSTRDLARQQAKLLRDRQREERTLARETKRREQEEQQRRLKHLNELKQRRADAMGSIRSFGAASLKTALWAGAGAIGVGTLLTKGFVDSALAADNARMSIATMVQSAERVVGGPFKGVQDSLGLTTDLIKQMRQAALETPAGFEDIQQAFKDVAVPARMAGSSYKDIIELASNMSTLNKVLGFEEGVVSRDVQQLLRGDIGDISTPMLRANRMAIQKLFKDNKHSEMLAKIRESLAIDPEMKKLFEDSAEGRISQTKDQWEMFKAEAGTPILGWISEQLAEALEYIQKNREEVKQWAKDLGTGLKDALLWIKDTLAWMWTNRDEIIGWAKWLGGAAGIAVAATALGSVLGVLKTIIGLGPALAGALAPLAGGAIGALGKLGGAAGLAGLASGGLAIGGLALAAYGVGHAISPAFESMFAYSRDERQRMKAYSGLGKDAFTDFVPRALEAETYASSGSAFADALKNGQAMQKREAELKSQRQVLQTLQLMGTDTTEQLSWLKNIHDALLETKALAANYNLAQELSQGYASTLLKNGWNPLKDSAVTPKKDQGVPANNGNIDARGARITINQRVETNNPAALARASLSAGFEAVARRPIRPNQPTGSVRLANGDGG